MTKTKKSSLKLLCFLLTLAMLVGLMPGMSLTAYAASTTVTWNASDISGGSGSSFTKGGITFTPGMALDWENGVFNGGGTFTTTLGKFTKIEVTFSDGLINGEGWSGGTWTGEEASSSVSYSGMIDGLGSIVFTIETAATYEVTYKVVNGTWSDDSTADKTENVQSGSKPASVPTGMKAASGYTGGAWDTDPAEATITGATTFTYTFTANPTYTVTVTNDGHGTATASPTSGAKGTEVTLTATPATGYKFKEWTVISGNVTIANNKFTIGTENVEIKAIFEAKPAETYSVTVVGGTSDKATAEAGATVTITATIPDGKEFVNWTTSDVEGLNGSTAVTTTFTMPAKAVTVTANFKDKSSGGGQGGGGYTPVIPSYTPTTTTTTTTNTGSFADKTEENNNYAGAEINMKTEDLEKAVLTDEDKKVIAAGGNVTVELEVEEKTPTAEEKKEIETAVEAAKEASGEDYTVAMYFDANLFKTSNGTKTQLHETNGKIAVSFKLPAQFKNTDSSVTRTYAVARIHDGKTEILVCEYDPETDLLTFYTDKFSTYALMYEDAKADDADVSAVDDDDEQGDEGVVDDEQFDETDDDFDELTDDEGDFDDDFAEDQTDGDSDTDNDDQAAVDAVVDNGETNPNTGAPLAGMGVFAAMSLFAAAAAYTAKKRKNK